MTDGQAKVIAIGGLAGMAAIATVPVLGPALAVGTTAKVVWAVVAGFSIKILLQDN